MKTIAIALTTPAGDDLAHLPVTGVAVPAASETVAPVRPGLSQTMADLYGRIGDLIDREGMVPAIEARDLQVRVSRALLADDDGEEIVIRIPVREAGPKDRSEDEPEKADRSGSDTAVDDLSILDDLFNLDDDKGGKRSG